MIGLTLNTKFVTMMKTGWMNKHDGSEINHGDSPGPLCLTIFSFAASLALVDEAGYSPPTP